MSRHLQPQRRRHRRRTAGQALLIFTLAFGVLVGFVGLSVDVGHGYVSRRQTQDASDAAALAGGRQLAVAGVMYNTPPDPASTTVLQAAHDYAQQNGYATVFNRACESYLAGPNAGAHLDETWFNSGFSTCAATTGFTTKVEYHTPPIFAAGEPPPPDCAPSSALRYNCSQVIITSLTTNFFMGTLGFPSQYTTTRATAFAQPPSNALATPPATAVYLYQPQVNCVAANQQCFNDAVAAPAPNRSQLSCTGGNCPTFWSQPGTAPSFYGFDGSGFSPPLYDTPALESNGDMVIQDTTTFCDPYGKGATWCSSSPTPPAGAQGYSAATGSTLFCTALPGATFPQAAPATPNTCSSAPVGSSGWPAPGVLAGNGTKFIGCSTVCSITVSPTKPPDCGGLILNGETVQSHYATSDPCYPPAGEEYTLIPGKYQYIVINHGQYSLEGGIFEITGKAPVNTASGPGYIANGIDHSQETAADFDLCTGAPSALQPCAGLTAGVWIGHGGGGFSPPSTGAPATKTCTGSLPGTTGTQAGGGDATGLIGAGVTFKLDSTAGGFVSTNEVSTINLQSPGANVPALSRLPVLIDMENSSFIHLDAFKPDDANSNNLFSGIIYQTPNATAGGVELNPAASGPANGPAPLVQGQILAYSLATFGGSGTAVDFSGGYGTGGGLAISSSGKAEPEIIVSRGKYSPRKTDNADGTVTFSLDYTDEWALDAYDTYVKVNSGSPVFFSQNIWSCTATNSCGYALPPQSNVPSDAKPALHGAVPPPGYTLGPGRTAANPLQGQETVASTDDWIETVTSGGKSFTFETLGQWTWGHEKDLGGKSMRKPDLAEINVTFPKPTTGSTFTISIFMLDGDHCGDYATAQYTFPNTGVSPGGGSAPGGVSLEE